MSNFRNFGDKIKTTATSKAEGRMKEMGGRMDAAKSKMKEKKGLLKNKISEMRGKADAARANAKTMGNSIRSRAAEATSRTGVAPGSRSSVMKSSVSSSGGDMAKKFSKIGTDIRDRMGSMSSKMGERKPMPVTPKPTTPKTGMPKMPAMKKLGSMSKFGGVMKNPAIKSAFEKARSKFKSTL